MTGGLVLLLLNAKTKPIADSVPVNVWVWQGPPSGEKPAVLACSQTVAVSPMWALMPRSTYAPDGPLETGLRARPLSVTLKWNSPP